MVVFQYYEVKLRAFPGRPESAARRDERDDTRGKNFVPTTLVRD